MLRGEFKVEKMKQAQKKPSRQINDETVYILMFSFNNDSNWIQFNQFHLV